MRHLCLTNAGRSYHDAGSFFFDGPSIQLAHADAMAAFANVTLTSTFTVTTAALSPGASTDLFDRAEALRDAVYLTLAPATLPAPPSLGGGPAPINHDYTQMAAAYECV